jgi:hypothetical protein
MKKQKLELRMCGFTMYNLSDIQKGIQFGHSVVEYGLKHSEDKDYRDWASNYKTFIILNGGTSNSGVDHHEQGSMEDIYDTLVGQGIKFAKFKEPDLNMSLSGICLLVDERVFNRKKYPDFIDYLNVSDSENYIKLKMMKDEDVISLYPKKYSEWFKNVGGDKNIFLRNYLKQFKLA